MTATALKSSRSTPKGKLPEHPRKGIFVDERARQYGCRVGYILNDRGQRTRAFQRLGTDADEATLKHIEFTRLWEFTVENWPRYRDTIRPGLPEAIRDTTDLSKPVWVKQEWIDAAIAAGQTGLTDAYVTQAARMTTAIDRAKTSLKWLAEPERDALDRLPDDLRARVLQALQPAANEVLGLAPDAKRLTIRQAADAFKEWKRAKIGSKVRGRRSGGGIKAATFQQAEYAIEGALKLMDESADLRTLTHDVLEGVIDKAYQKATSPATARKWMKEGLKPMLDWSHRRRDIDFRKTDETDELFALAKVVSNRIVGYTPETAATLKALKRAADEWVEGRGEAVWPYILLALNCGAYAADIASWTQDNLKVDGEQRYVWWTRVKSEHQNGDLRIRHDLWPETWKAIKPLIARDDKKTNPQRLLFLSSTGGAMYQHATEDKARVDLIRLRFRRMTETCVDADGKAIDVNLSFKSFRKIALNAVKAASGGSDDVTRKFAGQRVPGVLRNYLVDEYRDVSAALAKWHEQLKADGVL